MHRTWILSALGFGLAACAAPVSGFVTRGNDGGVDAPTALDAGSDIAPPPPLFPPDVTGPGVTLADLAIFDKAAGSVPPVIIDPGRTIAVPSGWPSPTVLAHTGTRPKLVRIEFEVGAKTWSYTALTSDAAKADPTATLVGSYWNVRMPPGQFAALKSQLKSDTLTYHVLYADEGATAPGGKEDGMIRLLPTNDLPDVTFWQVKWGSSLIRRTKVGSEQTDTVIDRKDADCIGCHSVTPDGKDVVYNYKFANTNWYATLDRPQPNGPPIKPPYLSQSAQTLLAGKYFWMPVTSAGAWSDTTGRWLMGTQSTAQGNRLTAIRVDSPNAQFVSRTESGGGGDCAVTWSPDAKRVVFASANMALDGYVHPYSAADLSYVDVSATASGVTFGARTPVPFASGTPGTETWPTYTPDGKYLAFVRTPDSGGNDARRGAVFIMPAAFDKTPYRLVANDSVVDASVFSDGLTNSWPRFGREPIQDPNDGSTWYPLIFSSRRGPSTLWRDNQSSASGRPIARLYYTVLHARTDGALESFDAILLPGQAVDIAAHSPDFTTVTSVPPPPPN